MKDDKNQKYLDPDFEYKNLTKTQLRDIMSRFNVEHIPAQSARKSEIIRVYEENIFNKIEELKKKNNWKFSPQNIFQSSREEPEQEESSESNSSAHTKIKDSSASSFISDSKTFIGSQASSSLAATISSSKLKLPESIKEVDEKPSVISKDIDNRINNSIAKDITSANNRDMKSQSKNDPSLLSTDFSRKRKVQMSNLKRSEGDRSSKYLERINRNERTVAQPQHAIRRFLSFIFSIIIKIVKLLFVLFVIFLISLKFFIPYCDGTKEICIPLPKYGYLKNGVLECQKGFKKVFSYIDYCVFDLSIFRSKNKMADKCIRDLQYAKGEYIHGYRSTPRVFIKKLTSDPEVIDIMKKSGKIFSYENGAVVEAINYTVAYKLRVFMIFVKIFWSLLSFGILVSFIIYFVRKYRQKRINKEKAYKISRNVMEVLRRQLNVALKSHNINGAVYSKQLQAAFNIKNDVWVYVEQYLLSNINIECLQANKKDYLFKWSGPIYNCYDK